MITSFDNNEDKVCLLLKDDVGGSRIKSRAKLHNPGSCEHGITYLHFYYLIFYNIAYVFI